MRPAPRAIEPRSPCWVGMGNGDECRPIKRQSLGDHRSAEGWAETARRGNARLLDHFRRSRPQCAKAAQRRLLPSTVRAPSVPTVARKYPQELAGNQDSERNRNFLFVDDPTSLRLVAGPLFCAPAAKAITARERSSPAYAPARAIAVAG